MVAPAGGFYSNPELGKTGKNCLRTERRRLKRSAEILKEALKSTEKNSAYKYNMPTTKKYI
jgi:aspartate aminotransferase